MIRRPPQISLLWSAIDTPSRAASNGGVRVVMSGDID